MESLGSIGRKIITLSSSGMKNYRVATNRKGRREFESGRCRPQRSVAMSRGSKTGRAFWLGRAYSLSMSIRATLADSRCPSAVSSRTWNGADSAFLHAC